MDVYTADKGKTHLFVFKLIVSIQLTMLQFLDLRLPTDPYAEVHDVMVLIRVLNIYT